MWVILATFLPIIWYYFDLPGAAFVDYPCILIIVISTFVNKNVKSVLFFLGTVMLFLIAASISSLFGVFAFLLVLFAAGVLFDSTRKKEQFDTRNSGGGLNSDPIRMPLKKVANEGYGGYGGNYEDELNNSGFAHTNTKKHSGYQHKVDEVDDILGRSQRDREYEGDEYRVRCNGCNEPENHCRCCGTCDQHPCQCCRRCDSYPCECCDECGQSQSYCTCCRNCNRYPCECCNECGEANCRCCRRCDSYPCECRLTEEEERMRRAEEDAYFYRQRSGYQHKVDEADDVLGRSQRDRDYEDDKYAVHCNGCNEPENHCRCCDTCDQHPCRCCRSCNSYPCECCDECGQSQSYCKCCRNCDRYPCECCNECREANCRCCSSCNSYPCECCDECGQSQSYCKCCRNCDRYPCECCNECREANCRCCNSCNTYPCECCNTCGQPDRYCRCD
ncbi:keratin associated protein 5-4 [Bacillus cereus]|uniref:Keratin associated protein 5-4 n=1 Tax=Bacillus cereus TaxID=1396 RepID=A0A162NWR8_BACCE|nr:keratin associated protein 5-4 [Bacillus cereus]